MKLGKCPNCERTVSGQGNGFATHKERKKSIAIVVVSFLVILAGFLIDSILYGDGKVVHPAVSKSTKLADGEYWCMGKGDTCQNKTYSAYDLYCSVCDPDGDNIEGEDNYNFDVPAYETDDELSSGEYWCMGKGDTCPHKTYNPYDLYCSSCDPDGDNIEG